MGDVLHGTWLPHRQRFWLWGESDSPQKQRKRRSNPPIHPFQSVLDTLHEQLADLPSSHAIPPEQALTIWLPTVASRPLPSPELLAMGGEPVEGTPELRPWQVTGLLFTAAEALDLLLDSEVQKHAGTDLRTWHTAALLVYELISGQQLIPGLRREKNTLSAHWLPRPTPATAGKITALARAMPPLVRAVVADPAEAPATRSLLDDFVAAAVDSSARELLQSRERALQVGKRQIASSLQPALAAMHPNSVSAIWLNALITNGANLPFTGRVAEELLRSWRGWAEQEQVAGDEAFRITFRLEPPAQAEQPWALSYLLQATDDPSLLVGAEQIWRERGALFTYLDRRFEHPQERLLRGLGFAARLFPPIEASLRSKAPAQATFDAEQALLFLQDAAPLLEQSGFGVLIPGWWADKGRLKARARVSQNKKSKDSVGGVSLDQILSFRWELSIGDNPIDAAEFERLVALKQPIVQVRGEWVVLDPTHMQQALKLLKRADQMTVAEALRLGLSGEGQALAGGITFAGLEAEGRIGELLRELNEPQQLQELPQPNDLNATLRPYQVRGFSWLAFMRRWGLGACLADDMGLGKCLLGESLVFVNGMLKRADDLWSEFAINASFDGEGYWAEPDRQLLVNAIHSTTSLITLAPIRRLYRQYIQEKVRTISLEDGSKITITQSHKLLTSKGWSNRFTTGDYICVPARLLWPGEAIDHDLVTLLAWQIAEGYEGTEHATLMITQQDIEVLNDLLAILRRLQERYHLKINSPSIATYQDKAPYLVVNSVAYRNFLASYGYQWGRRSAEKRIPDFIMQADLDSIRLFLRCYFDAEGSVSLSMRSVEVSSASFMLMQQLSLLLRRFGIWLRISQKRKRATNGSGIFRVYQYGIIGGNGARRFLQEIGFGSSSKQALLKECCASQTNTNIEGIPASELVSNMVRSTRLPVRHFGMHNTVYINGSQQFSQESLQRVLSHTTNVLSGASEMQYRELPASKWTTQTLQAYAAIDKDRLQHTQQELQRLLDQEVFYCRIKSIEEYLYEGWVYDFEVKEQHNFVANHMLCHNTVQATALLLHDRKQHPDSGPTLIVCPTSVVGNWRREIERFAPTLRVLTHQGSERLRGEQLAEAAQQHDVVLTSYPLLTRDEEHIASITWRAAILDEAQNIKNSETRQARAARSLQAGARLALTGTPVENRLTELWSIMAFLNPGYLGSESDFRLKFARPIERTGDSEATRRLKAITGPFVLRRLKTDPTIIADLPDKIEMKVYVPLTAEQATLYAATVREALDEIEEAEAEGEAMQRRGKVLAMLVRLKQICNHPAHFLKDHSALEGRSGKLERLEEMLEEALAEGDRALIFTQFAEMGELLFQRLPERLFNDALFLHGGTPARDRESMVRRFQAEEGPGIFILSLKAGGVGLNLTKANHVFHFDRWWNPAVENQATDRAFRIGQMRNVQVHKFICTGTLEERIDDMIERKRALAENVLGTGEGWLTELSTAQLRELVMLREDAIGE